MKVEKLDDGKLIVFLNNLYLKKNSFSLKNNLEKYFKNLFIKLNEFYDIEIKGFYNINIYQDNLFGIILEMDKEDLDFYGFYDDHIDMKIKIMKKEKFLFALDKFSMLNKDILDYCKIYKYNSNFYVIPKRTVSDINIGFILENSKIIYGEDAYKIINKAKLINNKKLFV